MGANLQAV